MTDQAIEGQTALFGNAQLESLASITRRLSIMSQNSRFGFTKPEVRGLRAARNRHYSTVS